jgi:hypothetical protein
MINLVLKIKENKTLFRAYHTLSSLVQVIPYYIMEEVFINQDELNIIPGIEDFEITGLTDDDMAYLGNHEEGSATTEQYNRMMDNGCLCVAAKYKGEIASYSWADPHHLNYKGKTIVLKQNEAYLFDARTYKAFRGNNLAPYVRYELYKLLRKRGIDRFLSITILFNTASMRFKQKLGAKPMELFLYVGLFRKFHIHFRLRNMAHHR